MAVIFVPAVPEGYECVILDNPDDYDIFRGASPGEPLLPGWRPLPARILPPDEDAPALRAQLPWLADNVLALRDEAISTVGPLLQPFGELLPLSCPDGAVMVFRSTIIIDALDEERSEIVRFSSGRIMSIESYAFRPGVVKPPQAYLLAQMPRGSLYLTEDLVRQVETFGYTGTLFQAVGEAD